ncbi:MAG: recombinase XerD, partial [Erythrobacter sp.]|nr:recombinase XerD [Erythrobacter sp.]
MSASTDAFLAMLAAERGAAMNTLAAYRRDLDQAEEAIGDLAAADRDAVASLAGEWASLAPASVARKTSALRQFFGFAIDEGWRSDDPSGALPAPRLRRPLPKVVGHDQIAALFKRAEDEAAGDDPKAVRLLALIELLYGSGLRATELVSLPLSAVPRDAPFLTVTGKGGATRLVPVGGRALEALARWQSLRPAISPSRFLFPSGKTGHLSRVRLFQLLKDLAGRAGLDPG